MEELRIHKWLSQLGTYSRRQAEELIRENRVLVNGQNAVIGQKVRPSLDKIKVDGKIQRTSNPSLIYWMYHKPDLTLVSRVPEEGKKTIYESKSLKSLNIRLNSFGRLDFRTEGLLLLSNDGDLQNKLCHPSSKISRVYHVIVNKKLSKEELYSCSHKGIKLKDGSVNCKIEYIQSQKLGKSRGYCYKVVVFEGRNRLVRRMFEALDLKVIRLFRVSFADITIPLDLKPGCAKPLSSEQIQNLKKLVKS